MRLIDADALELGKFIEARTDWHIGWNEALEGAAFAAPTIDAVEVVHGRWVVEHEESVRCSECCFNRASIKIPMDYCPNCGAKMDGERKDE